MGYICAWVWVYMCVGYVVCCACGSLCVADLVTVRRKERLVVVGRWEREKKRIGKGVDGESGSE